MALTHIYFELRRGESSRLHRVSGDEVWNLYSGGGVRLRLWDDRTDRTETIELSADQNTFCHVIPGGWWQAAEPIDGDVLVGCSVAPGFDFDDFSMLCSGTPSAERLLAIEPEWGAWLA